MIKVLKHISAFFFSLNTAICLLVLLIVVFLAGALIMPVRSEFQSIHSTTFFEWLVKQPAGATWWLWCAIGILCVLTVNTLFCSIESIIKKRKVTQWLLLISPQIIHIGFLFILLAHLLSSIGSSMDYIGVRDGTSLKISEENTLRVKKIKIHTKEGYIADWQVDIEYLSDGKIIQQGRIRPNSPFLSNGLNVNVKDLRAHPYNAVLLQISREPGAFWALTGGIL
ncbi:MAG TPA: hypothetical protein ENH31_02925, partial [Nitrospirae bacterium]|nr:hypothetical protein [Nitrospirota bacterium]